MKQSSYPSVRTLRQHLVPSALLTGSLLVFVPCGASSQQVQQTLLARTDLPAAVATAAPVPLPPSSPVSAAVPADISVIPSDASSDSATRPDSVLAPDAPAQPAKLAGLAPADAVAARTPLTGAVQQTTLPSGQQPPPPPYPDSFLGRYQARVTATQNEQPHWITPLVTVTPRLEQELRTDFVHYHNTHGYEIWNYGNSKGLELIPEKHTELVFNVPPFFDRSNGESDGFGDVSFLLKERLYSRNEENGSAIVTAFLGATLPTGKNGNGSCCATITPTLAVGKGFGNFDVTSTAGGSLPVTNVKGLGHSVVWNNVAQYRLAKTGVARFFWPEFEANSTFFKGGSNDGKTQVFGTPGLVVGRIRFGMMRAANRDV